MKTLRIVTVVTLILGVVIFISTITDFMALHDIWNDYVSEKMIDRFANNPDDFPDWTKTTLEWQVINTGLVFRFFFIILNLFILLYFLAQIDRLKTNNLR